MLVDARELPESPELSTDVCLIGAGAAGITIARELAASGHGVIVLEGGGEEYDADDQLLYRGHEEGTLIGPEINYLVASRLRYLGGSTNHWNGWCRPLDPEDLKPRDWVAGSGWPIDFETLARWYERANGVVQIPAFDYDPAEAGRYVHLLKDDEAFETVYFHVSPPTRFGRRYRPELEAAENVRLLLHANALRLEANDDASAVTGVRCATPDGRRFQVKARRYVVAAGAVENARLLLASNDVAEAGLGNARDLVGRYFMDHPSVRIGQVAIPYWRVLMSTYEEKTGGYPVKGVLRVREAFKDLHRLVNGLVVFWDLPEGQRAPLAEEVSWLGTDLLQLDTGVGDPEPGTMYFGRVDVVTEQLPDRENRVRLASESDRFGVPRADLRWRITERDERQIRDTVQWLARRLGARLRGRLLTHIEGDELWERTRWSNHHIGTTRMADSPEHGVVDGDCRVHGISNLFVAGSSVFPTSGAANPTYTIVALALRLAERLRQEVAG